MHQDIREILIHNKEIEQKITELGAQLSQVYQDRNPLCVGILKGAVPFAADLVRRMDCFLTLDFMAVSSYGNTTESSGVVRIVKDLETTTEGRDVLIIEDIIDTGLTLSYLVDLFKGRKAKSIKTITLLDKPSRRIGNLVPDYVGFQIPDEFVVGYGLDFAEKYRNLPYLGVLKEEVYRS